MRGVLRILLSQVTGVALTGEFAYAGTGIAGVHDSPPDAMLLDIQLNAGNGMDVLQVVSQECPNTQVFVVTNHIDEVYRARYLRAGACAFFDKSREFRLLRRQLQKTCSNFETGFGAKE